MDNKDFAEEAVEGTNVQLKNVSNKNYAEESAFEFTDFVDIEGVMESVPSISSVSEVADLADHRFEPYYEIDHPAVTVTESTEDNKYWCNVYINLRALSETEKERLAQTLGEAIEEAHSR
jgi:hypothetical protein